MSKADYPYPEDEFDAISPDAPTGVHRAPRSAWSRWWPFLVVLVVVPAIAYGAVTYFSRTGDLPVPGGTAQDEPAAPPEEPAGDGAAPDPAATQAEQPPVETTAPEPVLTTPVAVLNGARVSGLAGRVADKLKAAGFTAVTPDNATDTLPASSTVYMASEDQRATAELVASTVGISTVEVSPEQAGTGIAVVLVTDPGA